MLSQVNPIQELQSYFCKFGFFTVPPLRLRFPFLELCRPNSCTQFVFSPKCHSTPPPKKKKPFIWRPQWYVLRVSIYEASSDYFVFMSQRARSVKVSRADNRIRTFIKSDISDTDSVSIIIIIIMETVSETSDFINLLTRMSVSEDFIVAVRVSRHNV
jgi:hypothetical protein